MTARIPSEIVTKYLNGMILQPPEQLEYEWKAICYFSNESLLTISGTMADVSSRNFLNLSDNPYMGPQDL